MWPGIRKVVLLAAGKCGTPRIQAAGASSLNALSGSRSAPTHGPPLQEVGGHGLRLPGLTISLPAPSCGIGLSSLVCCSVLGKPLAM